MIRVWLGLLPCSDSCRYWRARSAPHLAAGEGAAELLRTAAVFGLPHAAALVGIAALTQGRAAPGLARRRGIGFCAGGLFFCLSLFAIAADRGPGFRAWLPRSAERAADVGWAALGAHALPFELTKRHASR